MDKKEKILQAALKLFITVGFDGTSTSKIVTQAEVSNGTLFHYFKTKEELINELFLKGKSDYREYLLNNMKSWENTKSRIFQFWSACLEWISNNPESIAFYDMFSSSPYIDKLTIEQASRGFDFFDQIIIEGIANESLIEAPVELISGYISASINSFKHYRQNNPDQADEYQELAFKMLWRSIANF
jgi:AcrR family transcriptional regulator